MTNGIAFVRTRIKNLPKEMTADVVSIDRDIAELLLGLNIGNRKYQKAKAERYAAIMERGRWTQGGSPIRISKTGVLLDGQHQLGAIAMADVEFEYLVVWGLEDEAQSDMDTGSKRSLVQALQMRGETTNVTAIAAATRLIWQVDNYGSPSKWEPELTYTELAEYLDANPDIRASVMIAMELYRATRVNPSAAAAAHFFCAFDGDTDTADEFFNEISKPASDLAVGTTPRAVQDALVRLGAKRDGGVSRIEQAMIYDLLIRGYETYASGKVVASMRPRRPRAYRRIL